MKTTVIIPNYNGIKFLGPCLDSLKNEDVGEHVLIVVDDGSDDGSVEYLKREHPDVTVIEQGSNKGFAAAVNRGIEASDTEYVLLLNNDTTVTKDFVRMLEHAMERDPRIFSVSAKMLCMDRPDIVDGAGDYYCALGWAYAYGKDKPSDRVDSYREIFSACGGAALYRRSVMDEIGLFDEAHFAYLEDVDIGYRARLYGFKNVFEPKAVVYHKGSGFSGSRYNKFKISLSSRNSTYLICKNMPLLQQLLNLPFFVLGFAVKALFFTVKGFGGTYISGLFKGIAMGWSKDGRAKKARLSPGGLGRLIKIQCELWINIFRRFA